VAINGSLAHVIFGRPGGPPPIVTPVSRTASRFRVARWIRPRKIIVAEGITSLKPFSGLSPERRR
jgi:hypothetical protein